jgi:hypothetical protein
MALQNVYVYFNICNTFSKSITGIKPEEQNIQSVALEINEINEYRTSY